jgi:hypothetical protein
MELNLKDIIYKEWYTIVFSRSNEESPSAQFNVYEVSSRTDDPNNTLYRSKTSSNDTSDFNESKPIIFGFLKWDGCIDFNCDLHMCGYRTIIQDIIKDLYLEGSKIIKGFDEDCADLNLIN